MGWARARFFFLLAVLALFLAGAQNAFVNASDNDGYFGRSILAKYPVDLMMKDESAPWRYRGRTAGGEPAFVGSTTFAIGLTDFFHWSRFWQMTLLSFGAVCLFWCGYYWPYNMRGFSRFLIGILFLAIGHVAYWGGLYTMWEIIFPRDGSGMLQTAADVWVEGFLKLHKALQGRGVLG